MVIVGIAFNLILIRCASIYSSRAEETVHDEEHTLTAMAPIDFSNTVSAVGAALSVDDLHSTIHGRRDSPTDRNVFDL